ncbi:MAG: hypothetical protein IJ518_07020 [Clostridia bacterium]|nr:hypothetical protein [Clostridia bacterium]
MRERGLSGNLLKGLACLSMLVDHMGHLLFPQLHWMRWVGRLALPLFAYFLAEGCRHTRNRARYFGRMLGLGCLCQAVYLLVQWQSGGNRFVVLNILLTLAVAQLLCFTWLDFLATLSDSDRKKTGLAAGRFLLMVVATVALCRLGQVTQVLWNITVEFDYGLAGMLLPLAALVGRTPATRLAAFGLGLVLFCFSFCGGMPYVWFALPVLPLLLLYSGKRGSRRWQPVFYVFYPAHLAVLYGLQFLL